MSNAWFGRLANATSRGAGKPGASMLAVGAVVVWAATGPWFHYGETWQLVINTGTTIITFLMVFLIQHSQNCDSSAVHIKLDEIISKLDTADNKLLDLEEASAEDLEELQKSYRDLANQARGGLTRADHSASLDPDRKPTPEKAVAPA
jgi:low affinity Fe/Cu permease